MKILITSDWDVNAINGVVTSILNLKEELEKKDHEVRFLTLSGSLQNEEDGDTYRLGSISASWIYKKARIRIRRGHKILDDIYSWGPDIVHSQCEFSSFTVARTVSQHLGIPLVHTCHTVYEDYVGYVLPFFKKAGVRTVREIFRFCSRRCGCFIAPTKKVESILLSYPVLCPVTVIPTGIKLSSFNKKITDDEKTAIREKLGVGGRKMLLFLGRLAKEKNISELLEYVSHLKRDDMSFVIVGDGPYRKELEREAEEKGLSKEKVVFAGMVEPEDVYRYYQTADLFINASLSETQGLTYIEALSSSLPLLVRYDTCLEGVVDEGYNGWTYNSEEEFDEYIETYFSKDSTQMRENARKKAMEFSASLFADRIEALYTEEIRKKKNE